MRKKREEMETKERKMREKAGATMGVASSTMSRNEKEGGAGEG